MTFIEPKGSPNTSDFSHIKNGNPIVTDPGKCSGSFGFVTDRIKQNCRWILEAKRNVFRYAMFVHRFAEEGCDTSTDPSGINCSSGNAEWDKDSPIGQRGGNDFIVSLGTWNSTLLGKVGGIVDAEAATFMHELGHSLGLGHGGGDFTNCKPNYLSVMNYTLQFHDADSARPLDYTSAVRGTAFGGLNETGLNENNGLGGTPNPARNTIYGLAGVLKKIAVGGAINWNGNVDSAGKPIIEDNIPADINYISTIGPSDQFGCSAASAGQTLAGYDDWANIQYSPRANTDLFADGFRPGVPELTGFAVLARNQQANLKVTKSVDKTTAIGGDTLDYTIAVTDQGPGPQQAINISWTDTLPDASTAQRSVPNLSVGQTNTQHLNYLVPCTTADGTVLTNSVTVTGTDEDGVPDPYTNDNTASATTTVQAPKLTVTKTATARVNAGEAITYTITYSNTGTGGASNVVITDILPEGVYYSTALDLGTGPKPNSVTLNANGTRTLVWNVGNVAASTGTGTIVFTARSTLLSLRDTPYTNNVSVSYQNASGACPFAPVTASAVTTITDVPPTRDPQGLGFWRTHPELHTTEILARIQATDQRFDGADGTTSDGALSAAEVTAVLVPGGNMDKVLEEELIATYFNLATRRINPGIRLDSRLAGRLGLATVRHAALYAQTTLSLPVNSANRARFSDATTVLDEINNKSEVY